MSDNPPEVSEPSQNEGELHPLMVDHILEKIFEIVLRPNGITKLKCDSKMLGSVRLVCKHWNQVATSIFRRLRPHLELRTDQLSAYLEVMKSSNLIPFVSYTISPEAITQSPGRHQHGRRRRSKGELILAFLRICGSPMVLLDIAVRDYSALRISFPRGSANMELPCLKFLRFSIHNLRETSKRSRHKQDLVTLLLNAAPNLHAFGLEFLGGHIGLEEMRAVMASKTLMVTIFSSLPESTKAVVLTDVPMDTKLHANVFEVLSNRKLKLEKFALTLEGGIWTGSMYQFLETQAPWLKVLELGGSIITAEDTVTVFTIPPLPVLEELTMFTARVVMPSSIEEFPKLKKIDASKWLHDEVSLIAFLDGEGAANHPLAEFHLPSSTTVDLVRTVGRRFPNLKSLKYAPPEECMYLEFTPVVHAIYEYYSNLERLDLKYTSEVEEDDDHELLTLDSLLSGIPEDMCAYLNSVEDNSPDADQAEAAELQDSPSITNLRKLQKLCLRNVNDDNPLLIVTNFSVRFVFLQMPSLKVLDVGNEAVDYRLNSRLKQLLETNLKII